MEAIAMKMTQEEFDSIKDLIKLPINSITDFSSYPYLVNFDKNNSISNINKAKIWNNLWDENPKVYEYFDKDILLKACDIEVEKVWHSSELQYINVNGKWADCVSNTNFRLKPQPDYSKEIESLQDKAKENGMKAIVTFEKL